MPRLRPACAAACLAILLMSALPAVGLAQRGAEHDPATVQSGPMGHSLVGAVLAWGSEALGWIRALIAAEHGFIVPLAPPPPATEPSGATGNPRFAPAP